MGVEIEVAREGTRAVVTVRGAIDEGGAEVMRQHFSELLQGETVEEVVLDMAGVSRIGSSGIGKILLFYKNLGLRGGRLVVRNLETHLYELFRELKLDTLFTVQGTVQGKQR